MQASKKNGVTAVHTVQRAAVRLRGEVIDHFAQAERAVSTVLVHAAALREYADLKPAFPHYLGQKLDRLRKLMSDPGPLRSQGDEVIPLIDKLAEFTEFRCYMAHATADVNFMENGESVHVFRMVCDPTDRSTDSARTLTLTLQEAQSRSARLALSAKALAEKLAIMTKDVHSDPKHPVKAKRGKPGPDQSARPGSRRSSALPT